MYQVGRFGIKGELLLLEVLRWRARSECEAIRTQAAVLRAYLECDLHGGQPCGAVEKLPGSRCRRGTGVVRKARDERSARSRVSPL